MISIEFFKLKYYSSRMCCNLTFLHSSLWKFYKYSGTNALIEPTKITRKYGRSLRAVVNEEGMKI